MRRRFKFRGKENAIVSKDYSLVKPSTIEAYVNKYEYESKDNCLEIGNIKNDKFLTVDVRSEADYVGDIRGAITNDYPITNSIESIPMEHFKFVRLVNTIEHIQWIYQDALLNWIQGLLSDGGMLYIETPNLQFITRVYLKSIVNLEKGMKISFPANEYPGMADSNGRPLDPERDLQKYINFKLFSGCSPGDFHHCCYDSYWLGRMLSESGFCKINVCSEDTLKVVAFKVGERNTDTLDEAVKTATR